MPPYSPEQIDRLTRLDQEAIWHPFTQMRDYAREEPIVIAEAQGCELIDIQGRRYLDGISSLWVNVHGHRQPGIDAAIAAQLQKVAHSTLLGFSNVPAAELAGELLQIVPSHLRKVFYSDSGSTAVEIALKMAFQYWQQSGRPEKQRFVTLKNAYHGDTLGSVSVGGMDLFHQIFQPLLFHTLALEHFDLKRLETIFQSQGSEIAAMIVEPMIQGAAGMLLQPPGFLRGVQALCRRYDILLICDEVATGFGRTGRMFAIEHEGIAPDLLCLAKGLTGGYLPLAATLATERVFHAFSGEYREFKTFFHGHSYTGNPLACAAALANLAVFREEQVIEKLPAKIAFLKNELAAFASHPCVREIRHLGMMVGIELAQPGGEPFPVERRMAYEVCKAALSRGALLRPLGDVLVLMPPLGIELGQLKRLLMILREAMAMVLG